MSKREVDFELDFGLEATLVYYVVDYPEGRSLDIDWIYYTDKEEKHNLSFLLSNDKFRDSMQELAKEDFENPY